MKLTKLFGILLFVIAFAGNAMGQTWEIKATGVSHWADAKNGEKYQMQECGDSYFYKIDINGTWDNQATFQIFKNGVQQTLLINATAGYSLYDYSSNGNYVINDDKSDDRYIIVKDNKIQSTPNEPDCGPSTPYIKVPDKITIQQSNKSDFILIPISAEIKNCDDCDGCDFSYSLSGEDAGDFEIVDSKIKLKSKEVIGNYNAKLTVSCDDCSLDQVEIHIEGEVCDYPACYSATRYVNGVAETNPIMICTDNNGDIYMDVCDVSCPFYVSNGNSGYETDVEIKLNSDVKCRDFTFYQKGCNNAQGKNFSFDLNGSLIDCRNFNADEYDDWGGTMFLQFTDCNTVINASDTIYIHYKASEHNALVDAGSIKYIPLKGLFKASTFELKSDQGYGLKIDECAEIYANKATIEFSSGKDKELSIEGHIEAGDITINNMVVVENGGLLTVGKSSIDANQEQSKIIKAKSGSIINLCVNPTHGADKLGMCDGCTIFYNYGEYGWDNKNPLEEGDVTGTVGGKGLIKVYESYEDCISEKNLSTLLGIDDDSFIPKDKEIRKLYNCNPCSKDFEDTKIKLREIHGRTFRLINGEFIYCENDNDD